jgi:hypothetical protein
VPDAEPSRRERRPRPVGRSLPLQVATALVVVGLLVAAALVFFGGDDGDGGRRGKPKSVSVNLELVRGASRSENAGPPAELPVETQDQIMELVGDYVDKGVIRPLKTGERAPDLSGLFDLGAAGRLEGPDRPALFEEGMPPTTIERASAFPVSFTGLSDANGSFVLVTAGFGMVLDGENDQGPIKITRTYELTFLPEGGTWRITGYDIVVVREGGDTATTTTTATAP